MKAHIRSALVKTVIMILQNSVRFIGTGAVALGTLNNQDVDLTNLKDGF